MQVFRGYANFATNHHIGVVQFTYFCTNIYYIECICV